jgi:hyperosmotically inducible periplasmic protein
MHGQPPTDAKPSSNILPGVIAAFIGATLVVACDRPDARSTNGAQSIARNAPERAQVAQSPNAAPAPPQPASAPLSREAITDPVITGRIKSSLATDPGMAGADVSVNTDRGVVSLAGTVKSHEQTGIASAHAQRQDGVVRVDNHLAMSPQ